MKNFYIYVDKQGKMPQLRANKWASKSHPYYVQYINDKPVAYKGPLEIVATKTTKGPLMFWDYSINEFVSPENLIAK